MENICIHEDKYFFEDDLLSWTNMIENSDLHNAIKSLSIKEQILISYIFYNEKTQNEVAKIYNVSQPAIFQKLNNIFKKIKIFMSKK